MRTDKTVLRGRIRALESMHYLMTSLNDERLELQWLAFGVPDEAEVEDLRAIADDEASFDDAVHLFRRLVSTKAFKDSGFYFG